MTATCRVCGLVQPGRESGACAACERREAARIAWSAAVAAPKCPCGKPLVRCDDCGARWCNAPGHMVHECEVAR